MTAAPLLETAMSQLTDIQLVILSAAAAREDRAVLPLPETLTLNKMSLTTVINSLLKRGLIAEEPAAVGRLVWREEGDQRFRLVITTTGLQTIGVEAQDIDALPSPVVASNRPVARQPNRKAAAVLELLGRAEGAGIADMHELTQWQAHTIRAFLSGLRKKGMEISRSKDEAGKAVYRVIIAEEAAS